MKKDPNVIEPHEKVLTTAEFLESFNDNMPAGYPHVSLAQLEKFKADHQSLFSNSGGWTLDQHRKRVIHWLPQNL